MIKNKFVASEFGSLSEALLDLKNRNWVQDLITAHQQYIYTLHGSSFDSLVKHKRMIQLREQFNWLVWAISFQYFKSNSVKKTLPKHDSSKWSEGFEYKGLHI